MRLSAAGISRLPYRPGANRPPLHPSRAPDAMFKSGPKSRPNSRVVTLATWRRLAMAAVLLPILACARLAGPTDGGSTTGQGEIAVPVPRAASGWSLFGSEAPATAVGAGGTDVVVDPTAVIVPARPFDVAGTSGENLARARECLTSAIYYEAASEGYVGERAVAQVVLNRVRHPAFPNSVCGVVYQGAALVTGCQFTFACDGSRARRPLRWGWIRAGQIADAALGGYVDQSVGLATHYHTVAVHPYWSGSLTTVTTIGAHIFYRWQGYWGTPRAFSSAYARIEPGQAPDDGVMMAADGIAVPDVALAVATPVVRPVFAPLNLAKAPTGDSATAASPRQGVMFRPLGMGDREAGMRLAAGADRGG